MQNSNTKTDYTEIWNLHKQGKDNRDIARKLNCTREHVRQIVAHFNYYESAFGKREGLDAYQPRELMQHLAAIGYRGTLEYVQKIDITKL